MIDVEQYLQRIHYSGETAPTYAVLCDLQRQHLYHIPFENFAIHDKVPVNLDTAALFKKIVTERRGGFCYELNGLFYALLKQLGFDVRLVSAQVYNGNDYGPPFDHAAMVVVLDNKRYLSDVGFGEFVLHPLEIDCDVVQVDACGDFTVTQADNVYYVAKKDASGDKPIYQFSLQSVSIDDFSEMCDYHQHSPDSHFTQKRLISLATPNGRVTLSGKTLIKRSNGKSTEETLTDAAYRQALKRYFSPFPELRE